MDRPYVLLSCAMSLDGYIDDTTRSRLVLSGPADLDRVDQLRSGADAILVGAGTIRADNPRLTLRSAARREHRMAAGAGPGPVRVVVTGSGCLDPAARLFTSEGSHRLVYSPSGCSAALRASLAGAAEVVDSGSSADLAWVLNDLARRGIGKLMVEGGSSMLTAFLVAGLADELQLAVAPFFVGDRDAPRFAGEGRFPWNARHPARLTEVARAGDDAVLAYALSARYDRQPHPW